MSAEDTLIQVRQDKHQEANGGTYPLASPGNIQISTVLGLFYETTPVSINPADLGGNFTFCGRVSAFRKSGSIAFIKLFDSTGSIQVIVSKSSYADYGNLRLIDLGDIIEVTGKLCLSKTNEQSVLLMDWRLLTKAHKPPPEKFAGISDTELKYRKRYLDLLSSEQSRAVFTIRSHVIRAIRSYLEDLNFLEVETSTLNTISSGANAKPFKTHHNTLDMDLYLRIAPELYLKRLLVGGLDKVFEIGRNYRNEGMSTRHNPEFTMMECYEAYGDFNSLLEFSKQLLMSIDRSCLSTLPNNVKNYYTELKSQRSFTFDQFKIIPMWDAIIAGASKAELLITPSIHPLADNHYRVNEPDLTIINPNNARLSKIDIKGLLNDLIDASTIGHKIGVLFEYLAEPFLVEDYRTEDGSLSLPVFITQYPKEISPLARSIDGSPTLTDRFELFVDGRELCNAFQELNDPDEQYTRFTEQLENNDKDPMDYDEDYVNALRHGLPPAIGFGMGIDRLVMLLTNSISIKDVILFPTMKPNT